MRIRRSVFSAALVAALAFSTGVHAVSTLRVGNQVLAVGDSEVRVTDLLGKPSRKSHSRGSRSGSSHNSSRSRTRSRGVRVLSNESSGEKWQYHRDDHVTTVTLVDGKVSDIDDHRL